MSYIMFCWSPRSVALLKEYPKCRNIYQTRCKTVEDYPKCRNIYQTRCKFTVEDFVEIIAQLIQ